MAKGFAVYVTIGAKLGSSLGSAARQAENRFALMGRRMRVMSTEFGVHMGAVERRWGKFSDNASRFANRVSVPMAAMSALGGRAAYNWSKVGNELQSVTQMTDKQRKAIEAVARAQLGNPAENLSGALDLARSGFDGDKIAAALPTMLKLAKSDPSVDSALAADIATNVMQGMKVPVEDFAHAVDLLAFAASKSSTDVALMGQSFKYAGPLASRMGASMEDVTAGIMTMSNAGIKGSEAGVAMRSLLVRMVKMTKGGAATLDKLGINLGDYVTGKRKSNADDVLAFMNAQGIDARSARQRIQAAIDSGASGTGLYQQVTEAIVSSLGEGGDAIDRSAISDGVIDALTSGADKVDWIGFLEALRDKNVSMGDLTRIFDQRQAARIATMTTGGDLQKNIAMIGGAPGWLQKMFTVSQKGIVGSVGRMSQSLGNLVIAMSESGAVEEVASAIDKVSAAIMGLSKSNPGLLKFLTYGALLLAATEPLGLVVEGVAAGFAAVGLVAMASRFVFDLALAAMGFRCVRDAVARARAAAAIGGGSKGLPLAARALSGLAAVPFGPIALGIAAIGAGLWALHYRAKNPEILDIGGQPVTRGKDKGKTFRPHEVMMTGDGPVDMGGKPGPLRGLGEYVPVGRPTKRAGGGHVRGGHLYEINENGQELFVPSQSGLAAGIVAALVDQEAARAASQPGGSSTTTNDIHIYGADTPEKARRAVREVFDRLARQAAA